MPTESGPPTGQEAEDWYRHHYGPVEMEFRSEFSRLRIRRKGNARALIFVSDDGGETVHSRVDLDHPHVRS